MKKIVIVTTGLTIGGITSFVVTLANFIVSQGHEVTLMHTGKDTYNVRSRVDDKIKFRTYTRTSRKIKLMKMISHGYIKELFFSKFFYLLSDRKKVMNLKPKQKSEYIDAIYCEKNEEKYDIAISAMEFFCNNYIVKNISAKKKIGWIHPQYESLNIDVNFDKKTFHYLDNIVVVSEECKTSLTNFHPEYQEKIVTIKNILDVKNIREKSKEEIKDVDASFDGLKIVTVCRIDNTSKRIDRAVSACKALLENGIDVKWYLVGDGQDKNMIKQQINELGIESNFILLGEKTNPYPYVKYADLFVLTSQYEGKPIAVDEALVLKCPVVVTNYFAAKKQVAKNCGEVLQNDDNLFLEGIVSLLKNEEKLKQWKKEIELLEFNNQETYDKIINIL